VHATASPDPRTALNKGYELRVPADTTARTLTLYLGGTKSRGRIEVRLGDDSTQEWQRVKLQRAFKDPIVVVKALSSDEVAPAILRVDAIDSTEPRPDPMPQRLFGGAATFR
jgi:hypothetical protein